MRSLTSYTRLRRPSIAPKYVFRAVALASVLFGGNRSGSWSSRSATICCSASSSAWAWTTGCGSRGVLEEPRPAGQQRVGAAVFRRGEQAGEAVHVDEHFTVDGTLIQAWASYKSPGGPLSHSTRPDGPFTNCSPRTPEWHKASRTPPRDAKMRSSRGVSEDCLAA